MKKVFVEPKLECMCLETEVIANDEGLLDPEYGVTSNPFPTIG